MNCPTCQKTLPANYAPTRCPSCGNELPRDVILAASLAKEAWKNSWTSSETFGWLRFLAILLAPAVGSIISVTVGVFGSAVLFGLVGSLIAGSWCARLMMEKFYVEGFRRALLHFALAVVLSGVSLFLSFIGCSVGGIHA